MSLEDARKLASLAGRTDADAVHDLCNWINEEGPILRGAAQFPAVLKSADMTARKVLDRLDNRLQQALTILDPSMNTARDEKATRIKLAFTEVLGRIEDVYSPVSDGDTAQDQFLKDIDGAWRIWAAVREAGTTISVKPGPIPMDGLDAGAEVLARKYEELSRKPYTFDRYKGDDLGKHSSPWVTDGARFVACGLLAIFPDATDANLDSVMRDKALGNSNLQK